MIPFKSSLSQQLEEYISYRLSLGYTDRNLRGQLRGFDRYVCEKEAGLDNLEPAFFLELKKKLKDKPQTFNQLLLAVRGFFNYLVRLQIAAENPLDDIEAYAPNAFIPFVFSSDQTDRLLNAIQRSIRKNLAFFFQDFTAYIAILLLARCGMRISEPLRLHLGHYRSDEGSVYIEKTKFSKDRLIPVPKAEINAIDNYLAVRDTFMNQETSPFLLPGKNGKALSKKSVYRVFYRAVKDIGLNHPRRIVANTTFGSPTPHSLRHSFAVNTLKKIRKQGRSAQNALPILSVYLGHSKYRYTAVYLKVLDAEHRQGLVDFAISRQEEI
jgi:integrase/recombinase XerD